MLLRPFRLPRAARFAWLLPAWAAAQALPPAADRGTPAPGQTETARAELTRFSERVEAKPHPQAWWAPAKPGDQLGDDDGLRTHESSSAELAFPDETRVRLSENSRISLRGPGDRPRNAPFHGLELAEGQADVEARASNQGVVEVEIVIDSARVAAWPGPNEAAGIRVRRAASGDAHVMVYAGSGEVAAGVERVVVPRGMGLAVPKGGRPGSLETLLPAPALVGPDPGARLGYANPRLVWEPVADAVSYTVELCRDAACSQLVERDPDVRQARFGLDDLVPGDYFWRVTAASASGLDGFPSRASRFAVTSRWRRPMELPRSN